MLKQCYSVKSKKYGIEGSITDYSVVTKLNFIYQDREVEIAITRPFVEKEKLEAAFQELGEQMIDTYIENLVQRKEKKDKTMLHHWYIEKRKDGLIANGIVTGHNRLPDGFDVHTSRILSIEIDEQEETAIIQTKNTQYHCPLSYWNWERQDECPDLVEHYPKLKENYERKIEKPTIETGKVLLVLSNFDSYYFNNLYYKKDETAEPISYRGYAHVGMFQDSYLISGYMEDELGKIIDIRYFPHFQNIEFYSMETNDLPLYLENIGTIVLYAKTDIGMIELQPGERKEVIKENVTEDELALPKGDLYPAGMIVSSDL